MTEPLITMTELALVLGDRRAADEVEADVHALGWHVMSNWRGQPCLSAMQAKLFVANATRRETSGVNT
jgi:hypothetical protein